MPSSTFRHAATPDDIQLLQEQDFDRWRAAVVKRATELIRAGTFALHHRPTEEIQSGVLMKERRQVVHHRDLLRQ
jgi:hypothetical protein